jgi:drug/metabolite transporter (DMT)-like permease
VLILHERFEPVHVAGIVVIFIGLIFMDGRLVKRLRPTQVKSAN